MLVVDASLVVEVLLERLGVQALATLGDEQLVAPWLLWSEVPAALSAMVFRRDISRELGEAAIGRLDDIDIEPRHPDDLVDRAWQIAKKNGWAKTYERGVPRSRRASLLPPGDHRWPALASQPAPQLCGHPK